MTIIRTGLIATFGLLIAGLITPASAGVLITAKPIQDTAVVVDDDVSSLHAISDRGSWKKSRSRFKRGRDYGYDRHDGHSHRKYFKKKKKKFYKRGYSRGFDRGYDEGYYEGRQRSRFGHRHHRRHYSDRGYRGGVFFGDGSVGGGSFRFRF